MPTRSLRRSAASAAALALTVAGASHATTVNIDLNYNFNGIWHGDAEAMGPTEESGFRSISDRALNFSAGVPDNAVLNNYSLASAPGVLDMVHLGNRNATDNGNWAFDAAADGDNVGIQPDWLGNPDQTGGPATTTNLIGIALDATSSAGFLYHISNGGGSFDVRFGFSGGGDVVATLNGGDWWAGAGLPAGAFAQFPGMGNVDNPGPDADLGLWEGTVDLSAQAGRTLTSITFENQTSATAGYGIYAANVEGTVIPEPLTSSLAALGLLALCCRRRRGV
jgi:hypothetical protein